MSAATPGDPDPLVRPVSPSAVTPEKLIQLYTDDDWELFVGEWIDGFDPKYAHVDRLGGAGDKGRDLVGYTSDERATCPIDIYQCKHYDHPLYPGDVWVELGKLCVFTNRGDYRVPRRYRFVAPRGVGTTLADYLTKPETLRSELMRNWADKCESRISTRESFPLAGTLKRYVEAFDFSIVSYVPVPMILEQHRRTPHWHHRFKRDYPSRPAADHPPVEVQKYELRYIVQLLAAYGEHIGATIGDVQSLSAHPAMREHFARSRTDFFMADSLNRFYRDQLFAGAFDDVKKQIYDGVVDTASASHPNGYQRVIATTQQAVLIPLSQTDHAPYVQPGDRKGICHHLANDDALQWVLK